MYTLYALRKWLLLTLVAPLFLLVVPAQAVDDVWTNCMLTGPGEAGPLLPATNEFTRDGYLDATHDRFVYWAGFAINGGFIDSSPNSVYKNGDVWGDIGAAGKGNVSLQDGFKLHKVAGRGGNVYYRTTVKYTRTGGAMVDGDEVSDPDGNDLLDRGANFALNVSDYAFGLASTSVLVNGNPTMPSTFNLKNQMTTVTLTSQCNVLNLQDFVIQGGTFTLTGTTMQSVIINVNRNFVLNSGAKIVLGGQLEWDDVLFNIHGKGSVVSFDQNARLTGIVLAPKRHVRLKGGSIVNGSVIGEEIELASLSQIRHPSVVSPIN